MYIWVRVTLAGADFYLPLNENEKQKEKEKQALTHTIQQTKMSHTHSPKWSFVVYNIICDELANVIWSCAHV